MLTLASIVSLGYYLAFFVFLRGVYIVLCRFWWGDAVTKPFVRHRDGSRVCEAIVRACSALESYTPPLLWGTNGHIQTILFGVIGRFYVARTQGQRHSVAVPDGSTVIYDVFEPKEPSSIIYIVCPGIGNCSETDYIRAFVHYGVTNNYRVAVLNHVGALQDTSITGNRLFTYGGTGDLAAMFEDLLVRYPGSQFVAVGFSLGANIVVRFIGEREKWRKHFVCAISICQGYDPNLAFQNIPNASQLYKLYTKNIITKQLRLIRRHQNNLLGETTQQCLKDTSRRHSDVTHNGHDCNGFSLDPDKISDPDVKRLWSSTNLQELDEYYTRRVMGFETVKDLWSWVSCVDLMHKVTDFPLLLVNADDDPVVPKEMHSIPMQYTDRNPFAMFVSTQYGGHLGFFEEGIIRPNSVTWVDRLIVQYTRACVDIIPKFHAHNS